MRSLRTLMLVAAMSASPATAAQQEGVVEGTFAPAGASVQVSAVLNGGTDVAGEAGGREGMFRLVLAAGTYTVVVTSPASSFPIRLENIVVTPGETTTLPPLQIVPGSGKAVLTGRVVPPRPESEVRLFSEGKERAAARPDREGAYEFRELPAGAYEVRATAPGHATDTAPVTVPENQRVRQTAVLIPIAPAEGVDWAAGTIRATGIGLPPQNPVNAASARAMTQRAALADGQRNLLRTVEQIKIDGDRSVRTIRASRSGAERVQGYLQGYRLVSERVMGDGRIEVILELPLTGPRGLLRVFAE